jgi:hypothetical protein
MRRRLRARLEGEANGLPAGEPLLREWLLEPLYAGALDAVSRRLAGEPPQPTDTVIAPHETVIEETAVAPGAVGLAAPTLTAVFHADPRQALEAVAPAVPVLLERVLASEEAARQHAAALLAFLGRDETLVRLRAAERVRDELPGVVADFCGGQRLADPQQVRASLTPRVLDNILWQAAATTRQQSTARAEECAGLRAVARALRDELRKPEGPEPPERTVRVALQGCGDLGPAGRLQLEQADVRGTGVLILFAVRRSLFPPGSLP